MCASAGFRTEKSLDFVLWFVLGFRKEENGEEKSQEAETAEHPKSTGISQTSFDVHESAQRLEDN